MRKNFCVYVCIFSFIILNILLIFNSINLSNNQNSYFRLHIVANSNSIEDQITKLNVSKKVTSYIEQILDSCNYNKNESKSIIISNLNQILEIANNEIKTNNKDYTSYANIGKISYEDKYSDVIDMEEGIYDSIQIVLGDGKGENFWSLIFPYSYDCQMLQDSNNNISNTLESNNVKIKSGIIEDIKKVVKLFS